MHWRCLRVARAGSGYITYDEFRSVSLVKLKLKMSESEVRALWCALDADDSNQLQKNEMGAFLRLAPTDTNAGLDAINAVAYLEAQKAAAEAAAAPDTARIDYAIPTHEMRTALADESVELPSGEALTELSRVYNENLERVRRMANKAGFSWFSLFQELDEDGACQHHTPAHCTAAA